MSNNNFKLTNSVNFATSSSGGSSSSSRPSITIGNRRITSSTNSSHSESDSATSPPSSPTPNSTLSQTLNNNNSNNSNNSNISNSIDSPSSPSSPPPALEKQKSFNEDQPLIQQQTSQVIVDDRLEVAPTVSIFGSSKIMSSYPPSNVSNLLLNFKSTKNDNQVESNGVEDCDKIFNSSDSIERNNNLFQLEDIEESNSFNNSNNSVFLNNSNSNSNNDIDELENLLNENVNLDLNNENSNSNNNNNNSATSSNNSYINYNNSNSNSNSSGANSKALPFNFDFKIKYHELYRVMSVYQLKDKIVVKPANSISNNPSIESLVIDRVNYSISSQYYSTDYLKLNSYDVKKKSSSHNSAGKDSKERERERDKDNLNNSSGSLNLNGSSGSLNNSNGGSSVINNNNSNNSGSNISLNSSNSTISTNNNSNNSSTNNNTYNINNSNISNGSTNNINTSSSSSSNNSILAYGIVGIINLISGPYLIVITGQHLVGTFSGKYIYRIENCNLILINNNPTELSEHDRKMESTYKKSLKSLLKSNFYYCFDYNISDNIENQLKYFKNNGNNNSEEDNSSNKKQIYHLFEVFNNRFFWNHHLQKSLIENGFYNWVLPLIRGYVEIFNFFPDKNDIEFVLISRRSRFRAGTRYNTRGSDLLGNVANYVETEQIISHQDTSTLKKITYSLVQTRGSIPLNWEQSGMKMKPEIKINPDNILNMSSYKLHFEEQLQLYGPQSIVTLLDQKGSESELGDLYKQMTQQAGYEKIEFIAFDFHHYCQGNRFDRVDILIDNLEESINRIGFTERNSEKGYVSHQNGLVRTNCLDCLDRTNLVQSMIGVSVLEKQLKILGIDWKIKDQTKAGTRQVKLAWANNGDAISFQYAGTQALKGDYTRTGKRNTKGVFRDGVNSLTRYYINTFLDKIKQVSIDLFLGLITVETNHYKFIQQQKDFDWGESRMDAINMCVDHFLRSGCKESNGSGSSEGFINAWIVTSINKRNQEQERILLLTPSSLVRCKYNFNENKIVHFKQFNLMSIKRIQMGTVTLDNGKKTSYGIKIYHKSNNSFSPNNSKDNLPTLKKSSSSKAINTTSNSNNNNNNNRPLNDLIDNSLSTSPPITELNNELSTTPTSNNSTTIDDSIIADCSFNQYIIPIPEGETIEFGKDLSREISESIRDSYVSLMGYTNINQLSYGSTFIIEQDFKRKNNGLVSSAYNSLKLGFYSKSPTVSASKASKQSKSSSLSSTTIVYHHHNQISSLQQKQHSNSGGSSNFNLRPQFQQQSVKTQSLLSISSTNSNILNSTSTSNPNSNSNSNSNTPRSSNNNSVSPQSPSTSINTPSDNNNNKLQQPTIQNLQQSETKIEKRRSKSFDSSMVYRNNININNNNNNKNQYENSEWNNYYGPRTNYKNNNNSNNNSNNKNNNNSPNNNNNNL